MARDLASRSAVPIFTSVESLILPGVVGGYVISGEKVGRTIARILLGRTPNPDGIQAYIRRCRGTAFRLAQSARRVAHPEPATGWWRNITGRSSPDCR